MRASTYFIPTLKEDPREAELISHRLMLRAALVRQLGSGLYTWLPLGLRVLDKLARIVRTELNRLGACELLLPIVQPAELWQQSQRWDQYGPLLLKMEDRHQRWFCFGPTHEEMVTALMAQTLTSYKQLPLICYQIQTKFRDEIRPRFGVMRAREFLMKDAYSFHADAASLQTTYEAMQQAYLTIFSRVGLNVRAVLADTGSIGGQSSHEFHVLAQSGEDVIGYSDSSDYAANIEQAQVVTSDHHEPTLPLELRSVPQPLEDWSQTLEVPPHKVLRSYFFRSETGDITEVVLRLEHQINPIKLTNVLGYGPAKALDPTAIDEQLRHTLSTHRHRIVVDVSLSGHHNLVLAGYQAGTAQVNLNWQRDLPTAEFADIRNVVSGDPSPDGKGHITLCRGIEVGHIFQLGTTYSEKMQACVLNQQGRAFHPHMGCYGIGVSRMVAATIEQHHDDRGIIWPTAIAPFHVVIIPVNYHKQEQHRQVAERLYDLLSTQGWDVMLDDRPTRVGMKLAEADLIGYPHRLVISDSTLANDQVEYKARHQSAPTYLAIEQVMPHFDTLAADAMIK